MYRGALGDRLFRPQRRTYRADVRFRLCAGRTARILLPQFQPASRETGSGKGGGMVTYLEQGAAPAIGEGVSVVAFSAKWCPPCKVMDPIYETAATRFPALRFLKANQEAVPDLF